ncbi:MAG: 30S ribosomal protein S4 [Clostridiales bacterium]|jgi:small subunit ribosomal protein S4|nr:30S ribosomal protein S4 [Clostridiales bacterium]
MAVNRQPVLKKCRSLGIEPAFLGLSKKRSRKKPTRNTRKVSEYGTQLKEKQKAKFIYGILERQFRLYFQRSAKLPGITGENLLILLETRLDNVVYRLGIARTRREARQIVLHKHVTVNGKKANIPSIGLKIGDVIEVKAERKNLTRFTDIVGSTHTRAVPGWLSGDIENLRGTIVALPSRDQIDTPVNETLIVELYSR